MAPDIYSAIRVGVDGPPVCRRLAHVVLPHHIMRGGSRTDTLVTRENLRVEFLQCDTARHVVPPLNLYAAVDAQLLRAVNRGPLHTEQFEYWRETLTFAE